MPDVKLLIFNTHGESIGRGGHPCFSLDRLNYINCSFTREKIKEWSIELIQEMSFSELMTVYQYFMNLQPFLSMYKNPRDFVSLKILRKLTVLPLLIQQISV